jgi:hypothetical protein
MFQSTCAQTQWPDIPKNLLRTKIRSEITFCSLKISEFLGTQENDENNFGTMSKLHQNSNCRYQFFISCRNSDILLSADTAVASNGFTQITEDIALFCKRISIKRLIISDTLSQYKSKTKENLNCTKLSR